MLAFLSASSSETSWTISGWLNFPARQEDGKKIRIRVYINLSSFIPELIRGSILWSDPCFTPTQNMIPVPSFRFGEGPTGTEHLELILFHPICHHAYGWEGGKELLMRQRARRNFTRQPLNASTRSSGKTQLGWSPESWKQSLAIQNLQFIGGTKHLHIKRLVGRPGGLGFPRMQTIMQTCLLQTPLC